MESNSIKMFFRQLGAEEVILTSYFYERRREWKTQMVYWVESSTPDVDGWYLVITNAEIHGRKLLRGKFPVLLAFFNEDIEKARQCRQEEQRPEKAYRSIPRLRGITRLQCGGEWRA